MPADVELKIISSTELSDQILSNLPAFQISSIENLYITTLLDSVQLAWVPALYKYILIWRNNAILDDHHLKQIGFTDMQLVQKDKENKLILYSCKELNLRFTEVTTIPMLDGSDFILTPAFGHAVRCRDALQLIEFSHKREKLNIIDIYGTKHGILSGLSSPSFRITNSDNPSQVLWGSPHKITINKESPKNTIFRLSNVKLLMYSPIISPSEGMRSLCMQKTMRSAEQEKRLISSNQISMLKCIPVISRTQNRHPRWLNSESLCQLNPACFMDIIPETYDPYELAELLDSLGPFVVAAPGSAAYIPLCLCKKPKLVFIPLAGNPLYNGDKYVNDFTCYSPYVSFIYSRDLTPWDWNDAFAVDPHYILSEIRKYVSKIKSQKQMPGHH